jgi:hypothetical protein
MAVKIKVDVFWVVTSCSVVVGYRHFRGQCYLLKMEEAWTSEVLVFYHITRRHNPKTSTCIETLSSRWT